MEEKWLKAWGRWTSGTSDIIPAGCVDNSNRHCHLGTGTCLEWSPYGYLVLDHTFLEHEHREFEDKDRSAQIRGHPTLATDIHEAATAMQPRQNLLHILMMSGGVAIPKFFPGSEDEPAVHCVTGSG